MSKIEVDQITQQSGTTLTVGGGACKTAAVDATTVTIGRSGGTVTLTSGATQSGFGRTGTVDWQTGSIKTATFTAANGEGYFCNTTGGSFEVDLPAGSAGAIVSIQDYNNTFDSNALTIDPNGSEKINGGSAGDPVELSTKGLGITFVYIDATVGWRSVQSNEFATAGSTFIAATGGNSVCTVDTNFKVHTFTSPGTFCVSSGSGAVDYVVVAGGGGSVYDRGGGGGAGGYREAKTGCNGSYTASPLANPTGVPLSPGPYSIVVGAGGAADNSNPYDAGSPGSISTFSSITSAGGGGSRRTAPQNADNGGSGGGGGYSSSTNGNGGSGNTPPVSPPQGNDGGNAAYPTTGGGGGATAAGQPGSGGKAGGAGATSSINGTPTARAGGGGGIASGTGGTGGGGNGSADCSPNTPGGNGTANTGGGGGGGGSNVGGGSGGSGVVIIRYRFQ